MRQQRPPNLTRERQKAVEWARTMLKRPAVIVDFETTGVRDAEIVQVGVLDMQGKVLMDTLVKPSTSIPAEVTAVHGIDDVQVAAAPTFPEVYVQFSVLLAGKVAIAYNAPFEEHILSYVCQQRRLPLPRPQQWSCAMRAYASYYGQWNGRWFVWQKLSEACRQQNVTVENAHNALGDCRMTLGLIQAMSNGIPT